MPSASSPGLGKNPMPLGSMGLEMMSGRNNGFLTAFLPKFARLDN
jgi:hypothetical protein